MAGGVGAALTGQIEAAAIVAGGIVGVLVGGFGPEGGIVGALAAGVGSVVGHTTSGFSAQGAAEITGDAFQGAIPAGARIVLGGR